MGVRHVLTSLTRATLGTGVAALMLVTPTAARGAGSAEVRFVQASPGASAASLQITSHGRKVSDGGSIAFGEMGGYVRVAAGRAKFSVEGATAMQSLSAGHSYTVIALAKDGKGVSLEVLKDGSAHSGKARLRVVHAAPELGSPDIRLGHRVIAQKVSFRDATPYVTVAPGSYKLAVTKPGGKDVVFARTVSLSAGTASTAIVAGSAGQRERVILA